MVQIPVFQRLQSREKMMVLALGGAVLFGTVMKLVYQPLEARTAAYKTALTKSRTKLAALHRDYPQMEKYRESIRSLEESSAQIAKKVEELTKTMPAKEQAFQLMGELTRLASGIELLSAKQKIEEGESYSRVFIEIRMNASFSETARYLRKAESISPFIRVEEMEIKQPKKGAAKTSVRLVISSLLGEKPSASELTAKEGKEGEAPRDIFTSKFRPQETAPKVDLKLEGITYNGDNSTAIINGDVVRINSKVGSYVVQRIMENGVMLSDGQRDLFVEMEKG